LSIELLLTVVGLAVAVIAIPLAWFFGRRTRERPDFRFAVDQEELISPDDSLKRGGLEVRFRGKTLERLCRSYVAIWNKRGDTIRGTDIPSSDPLRVQFPESDSVLSARVVSVSRDEINARVLSPDGSDPNVVHLQFEYLNPGDGYVVEFLHEKNVRPLFFGIPMGATLRETKQVSLAPRARSRLGMGWWRRLLDTYHGTTRWLLVASMVLFVLFVATAVLSVIITPPTDLPAESRDFLLIPKGDAKWVTLIFYPILVLVMGWTIYEMFVGRVRPRVPRTIVAVDYQAAFSWTPEIFYKDGSGELIRVGDMITHRDFGVGVITAKSGSGTDTVVTVSFETAGRKKLKVDIAPIEFVVNTTTS
jgi:hypothetical protein